jgi:hypothetical protein
VGTAIDQLQLQEHQAHIFHTFRIAQTAYANVYTTELFTYSPLFHCQCHLQTQIQEHQEHTFPLTHTAQTALQCYVQQQQKIRNACSFLFLALLSANRNFALIGIFLFSFKITPFKSAQPHPTKFPSSMHCFPF